MPSGQQAKLNIVVSISQLMSNLGWSSEDKCKLFVYIAVLVLVYEAPNWDDVINAKEYQRTEMVSD